MWPHETVDHWTTGVRPRSNLLSVFCDSVIGAVPLIMSMGRVGVPPGHRTERGLPQAPHTRPRQAGGLVDGLTGGAGKICRTGGSAGPTPIWQKGPTAQHKRAAERTGRGERKREAGPQAEAEA
ncbi:hypothetical protein MPTK1_5g16140 [Marchantia polymorpha subsp. ruderalis]|uniref:Uncharacterized protein n=2 Tax=Marchantia polymorpha TaxID=3197 RepID=A0AAF6BIV9_MARPO|nr:hypothetical protein MARPO_0185s0001 [Marchantia polymorpha]BBN11943.1 hypothetical protein Mp_5g16140 [Marchantia polymorpha subsp. ruderalis]|eukprot:PTQ27723.1 hypothetical protein MARPO_0185s0001 [Marchantia polymorpha]